MSRNRIRLAGLFIFLLSIPSAVSGQSQLTRILLLGTSYTYYNNMPNQIRTMAVNHGNIGEVEVESITYAGSELSRFLSEPEVLSAIETGRWDAVVLQGGSLETLTSPDFFKQTVQKLANLIQASGSRLFLFETYARAEGDFVYGSDWSGGNPRDMQKKISGVYAEAASLCDAVLIPVGRVLVDLSLEQDEIIMYDRDGLHPSYHGSYLTACLIFAFLFEETPESLTYKAYGISEEEAAVLRKTASEVFLASLQNDS